MNWCGRSLLKSPVRYGLCLSQEDFDIALIRLGADPEKWMGKGDEAVTHFHHEGDKARVIVCLKVKPRPIEKTHGILVHEAVHVWQEIREYIGEGKAGDEQEAYCIEQIAVNLFESYKKQMAKGRE